MRPSWNDTWLAVAKVVAQRSTCLRRKYGAVIVKNNRIVATGYNGSPSGMTNCCDTGQCSRQDVPHGERYELCKAIHAEQNAIMQAGLHNCKGAVIYLYGEENGVKIKTPAPCSMCMSFIQQADLEVSV